MELEQYRQGDVLVVRIHADLRRAEPVGRENGCIVLAQGEATGHAHAISEANAAMLAKGAARFLRVQQKPVFLRHEEHRKIELPPGEIRSDPPTRI